MISDPLMGHLVVEVRLKFNQRQPQCRFTDADTILPAGTLRLLRLVDQFAEPHPNRPYGRNSRDAAESAPSQVMPQARQLAALVITEMPNRRRSMRAKQVTFQEDIRDRELGTIECFRGDVAKTSGRWAWSWPSPWDTGC